MATIRVLEGDDHWSGFTALLNRFWREAVPGERPITVGELQAEGLHSPRHRSVHRVLAVDGDAPVGVATVVVDRMRSDSAWLKFLFVAPEHRGRGVGSELLDAVREAARSAGSERIRAMTGEGDAAGSRFAARAGGRAGLAVEQNRCPVAALDVVQLRSWVERATERAAGYSLVAFDGVCPDEHLEAFASVLPVMNAAPGSGQRKDFAPTPDEVRENMTAHVRQGNEPWTICAREDRTGEFVGYTEISFPCRRPWRATQGDTGVHPAHRNRGLGRWLKARNALRLLAEDPDVEYIETWNASTNPPMLSINRAMGFRLVATWQQWDLGA